MNLVISFDPKLFEDWNGSGCHTNYSTKAMREEGGYDAIIAAIEKLGKKHQEHVACYGVGNDNTCTRVLRALSPCCVCVCVTLGF